MIQPAVVEGGARAYIRRRLRNASVFLLVGVALLTAFVLLAVYFDAQNQQLVQSGVRVSGVVREVGADTKGHNGSALVAYHAAGGTITESVDLGADADHFHVGQAVDVYYDAQRPTHMTIKGEVNQPAWTVWAMIFMLVIGAFLVIGYSSGLISWLRCRHMLSTHSWRPGQAHTTVDTQSVVFARVSMRSEPETVLRGAWSNFTFKFQARGRRLPNGRVLVAGPVGHRFTIADTDGGNLLQLRAPRTVRQRKKWESAFH